MVIIGLSGAFGAHLLAGFCMWFISVSPVFIPVSYFLYFFSGPFLTGITAGLVFPKVSGGITALRMFLAAFICTFVGNFVAFTIAAFTDVSDLVEKVGYDRFTINRIYFTVLETVNGLVVMGVLIGVIHLWSRYKEIS